jgi:hypothetical protein
MLLVDGDQHRFLLWIILETLENGLNLMKLQSRWENLTKFVNSRNWINLAVINYVCDLVISIDFLVLGPFEIKWVVATYLMFMQPPTQRHNPHIKTMSDDAPNFNLSPCHPITYFQLR